VTREIQYRAAKNSPISFQKISFSIRIQNEEIAFGSVDIFNLMERHAAQAPGLRERLLCFSGSWLLASEFFGYLLPRA
jgi:hypothetical protein